MCGLFWGAHKSLAPRARTLLGRLGQATLSSFVVATLLFVLFGECPKFCDLAKQRRKFVGGVSEVGKDDFSLYFFWRCVIFLVFSFSSAAIARRDKSGSVDANGPHIARGPSLYSQPTLASLTFVKGRLWSAPEAIRCEQGVFFAIFHLCMCPLGRQRARPSKAPQVEHICGIEGHCVRSSCLEGLVNYSIQAEDITIYLCASQGTFGCFFANIAGFCPS